MSTGISRPGLAEPIPIARAGKPRRHKRRRLQASAEYSVCREIPYSAASPVFFSPAAARLRISRFGFVSAKACVPYRRRPSSLARSLPSVVRGSWTAQTGPLRGYLDTVALSPDGRRVFSNYQQTPSDPAARSHHFRRV